MGGEIVGSLLTFLEPRRPARNTQNQLVPVCHCDPDPKNWWGIPHAYSMKSGPAIYSGMGPVNLKPTHDYTVSITYILHVLRFFSRFIYFVILLEVEGIVLNFSTTCWFYIIAYALALCSEAADLYPQGRIYLVTKDSLIIAFLEPTHWDSMCVSRGNRQACPFLFPSSQFPVPEDTLCFCSVE